MIFELRFSKIFFFPREMRNGGKKKTYFSFNKILESTINNEHDNQLFVSPFKVSKRKYNKLFMTKKTETKQKWNEEKQTTV